MLDAPPVYLRVSVLFLPRVPLCACTFYLIMTDAAVRMCVTRESSREEEVRESRREVLLASAGHREIVRAHTSARDGCLL